MTLVSTIRTNEGMARHAPTEVSLLPEAKAFCLKLRLLKQAEKIVLAPLTGRGLSRRASAHGWG
jgi:hypothetical protein